MKASFIKRKRAPFEVFEEVTRPRHLRDIYENYIRRNQVRGRDGCTPESLAPHLDDLSKRVSTKLRRGTFRFTHYRELTLPRGAGKIPRVLSIPTARDRIAMRAIAELLGRVFPFSKGVLASQRVANALEQLEANAAEGRPFDSFVRLDVENFYPSIRHSDIEAQLRERIRKKAIISVVMRAVATPTVADRSPAVRRTTVGVPQGLAISNALAELIARPIDRTFKDDPRCAYFRYVDDILILCAGSDATEIANEVSKAFSQHGLTVHPLRKGGKSSLGRISEGFDYLGYVFKDSGRATRPIHVSVRKSSISAIEGRLTRIFSEYRKLHASEPALARLRCELQLSLAVAGCIFDDNPRGWLPYYRQLNDLTLLKHLDSLIDLLAERYGLTGSFHPKRFVRAYWALRYPHGRDAGYIKSYDDLDIPEQREVLKIIIGPKEAMLLRDDQIPYVFRKEMGHLVSDLERDIGDRS